MTVIVIVKAYEMMLDTRPHENERKKTFNLNLYLLSHRASLPIIHFKHTQTGLTLNTGKQTSQANSTMENLVTFVPSMPAVCQNTRLLF